MIFRHRPRSEFPKVDKIKDEIVRRFGEELGRILVEDTRNIFDDLVRLEKAEIISSLPTANIDNRGKFYLVPQAAEDKLYICVLNTGAGTYSWKEVSFV